MGSLVTSNNGRKMLLIISWKFVISLFSLKISLQREVQIITKVQMGVLFPF